MEQVWRAMLKDENVLGPDKSRTLKKIKKCPGNDVLWDLVISFFRLLKINAWKHIPSSAIPFMQTNEINCPCILVKDT